MPDAGITKKELMFAVIVISIALVAMTVALWTK